jgi:uncharacterized membrane protein
VAAAARSSTPPDQFTPERRALARLLVAVVAAACAGGITATFHLGPARPAVIVMVAYVTGAATFVAMAAHVLLGASCEELAAHGGASDPDRGSVLALVLGATVVIVGGAMTLSRGLPANTATRDLLLALTLAATALAWLVTTAAFALHYARLFYEPADGEQSGDIDMAARGFQFPGNALPDGADFAYLAFTVGMTFQVSDVQVTSRERRRAVLGHGLLAFTYNTLLIALVVTTALSQVQQLR